MTPEGIGLFCYSFCFFVKTTHIWRFFFIFPSWWECRKIHACARLGWECVSALPFVGKSFHAQSPTVSLNIVVRREKPVELRLHPGTPLHTPNMLGLEVRFDRLFCVFFSASWGTSQPTRRRDCSRPNVTFCCGFGLEIDVLHMWDFLVVFFCFSW